MNSLKPYFKLLLSPFLYFIGGMITYLLPIIILIVVGKLLCMLLLLLFENIVIEIPGALITIAFIMGYLFYVKYLDEN